MASKAEKTKEIYIIVSQTGSIVSWMLKKITGAKYNHASIALSKDLECMYSFGRRHPYNPFWGGFVVESVNYGSLKRFKNAKIKVLRISVDEERYEQIRLRILEMLSNKKRYHYNYLGLFLGGANIQWRRENAYYCSEFVKDLLNRVDMEGCEVLQPVVHPMQFLDMPQAKLVYTGLLSDYVAASDFSMVLN